MTNRLNKLRSLRSVIAIWYTIVFMAAFIMFGGGTYLYLRHALHTNLEQALSVQVDWVKRTIALAGVDAVGLTHLPPELAEEIDAHFSERNRNYAVLVSNRSGDVLYDLDSPAHPAIRHLPFEDHSTVFRTVDLPDETCFRVAAHAVEDCLIHVGYPVEEINTILRHLLVILLGLGPAVVLVAAFGSWLLTGRGLRPVMDTARSASRITAERLSERLPERDIEDEVGMLIKAFNSMIDRLEASFEQIQQFSANVAHELRTPLTILSGEAELALNSPMGEEEARRLAETYLEETLRIKRIVDDLLLLSKADAGRIDMVDSPVRIDELVSDVWEDACLLAAGRGLRVELGSNDELTVRGDAGRLRQLLRALISNAIRYSHDGGLVRMSSAMTDDHVTISVKDTGVGISEDDLPHIFDRFYRVRHPDVQGRRGSGLGLSLAMWIAKSHGGDISVTSEPARGSTFVVRLPLSPTA